MSEHSTVNTSEKTLVKPKHLGLFARKKKVEGDDQSAHKEVKAAPLAEELRPVGFTELFRCDLLSMIVCSRLLTKPNRKQILH